MYSGMLDCNAAVFVGIFVGSPSFPDLDLDLDDPSIKTEVSKVAAVVSVVQQGSILIDCQQ